MERKSSDLTSFAALLGESFAARVDMLSHILQNSHYPSIGTYKERLLIETLRNYLPNSLTVGTGFVMFPHNDSTPKAGMHHDRLNKCAFSISQQCDILVFDGNQHPPVFRDGDFVVLRPEAVKAVIEVKGSISLKETRSLVDSFIDFGRKWRTTQIFYRQYHQPLSDKPVLMAMCWSIAKRKNGKPVTNSAKIRKLISELYYAGVSLNEFSGFPILENLYIYGESEISSTLGIEANSDGFFFGWQSLDGCFIRFDEKGVAYRDKDRTVAALLARLHITMGLDCFNSFFSYTEETRDPNLIPYQHRGLDWTWCNIEASKENYFTSRKLLSN
ncbi:DUF6602 domain-containing protein [Alkalinema pantanalense CENA528]|uniref:DUF6602 domain-containing protein n=1 Tax=Alkalinema pantanalense TaxID=1620705 RepID=UPI003D6F6573